MDSLSVGLRRTRSPRARGYRRPQVGLQGSCSTRGRDAVSRFLRHVLSKASMGLDSAHAQSNAQAEAIVWYRCALTVNQQPVLATVITVGIPSAPERL